MVRLKTSRLIVFSFSNAPTTSRSGGRSEGVNMKKNDVDIIVGKNIKSRRQSLSISQQALADYLDLTFQQVQKYEKASNRVSAGALYKIALFLECTPNDFFEGLITRKWQAKDFINSTENHITNYKSTHAFSYDYYSFRQRKKSNNQ